MSIEVMKQALEALDAGPNAYLLMNTGGIANKLRQAIAEAEKQEPVAWIEHHKGGDNLLWDEPNKGTPLYTTREWVGLTDEDIEEAYKQAEKKEPYMGAVTRKGIAEAFEQILKEKNT